MFGGLYNIVFTDYAGGSADLAFLENSQWLNDAAVIPHAFMRNGHYRICLIFAWVNNTLRFICRYFPETFSTLQKAELFARYYQRTAQKDERGSRTIQQHDFNFNYN